MSNLLKLRMKYIQKLTNNKKYFKLYKKNDIINQEFYKEKKMNQILVTEKLYITPELKRKKKLFKIEFFLSVFLVCILSSYYIYAEYDRNKSEEVSRTILAEADFDSTIKQVDENDVMVILVENDSEVQRINTPTVDENTNTNETTNNDSNELSTTTSNNSSSSNKSNNKNVYTTDARLIIDKIGLDYPVLSETSEDLLEISINKYYGPNPNEIGNYCIVGHNYKNGKMFGQLYKLKNGDTITLEDMTGKVITYQVYNKYIVKPTNTKCTSQLTNGKREVTLITCANYGTERLIIKCREI